MHIGKITDITSRELAPVEPFATADRADNHPSRRANRPAEADHVDSDHVDSPTEAEAPA